MFWRSLKKSLMKPVMWMQIMDICVAISSIISFWHAAFPGVENPAQGCSVTRHVTEDTCVFLGMLSQFARSASSSWYFVITLQTFAILRGVKRPRLVSRTTTILQHAYVWGLASIATIVPLIDKAYGPTDGGLSCYIHSRPLF
eukprot:GABV01003221.1.p2 GENE.GABV01003221.1~~GABV01003221.1.p2  ORF type:complete len:143 (+),score=18.39 GABV01003221.1:133-561(+)